MYKLVDNKNRLLSFAVCALGLSTSASAEPLSLSLKPCVSSETVNTIEIDRASAYICALSEAENYLASPDAFIAHSYGDSCPNGFREVPQLKLFTERTFTACAPQDKAAFIQFFYVPQKSSLPIVHWFRGSRCEYGIAELVLESGSQATSTVGCVVN